MGAAVLVLVALIPRCILRLEMQMKGPLVDVGLSDKITQNEIKHRYQNSAVFPLMSSSSYSNENTGSPITHRSRMKSFRS